MADLRRLRTKTDRLKTEQARKLRQAVLDFPDVPDRISADLIAWIDRRTASENRRSFVMLSPAQNRAVVKWLGEYSKRPTVAVQLWSELFLHLCHDTGEIVQTRDELAQAVGIEPRHVSEIMSELEYIGAISRKRVTIPGMRGPGAVCYFMSPVVGTHLPGAARDKAQAAAPPINPKPPKPSRTKAERLHLAVSNP